MLLDQSRHKHKIKKYSNYSKYALEDEAKVLIPLKLSVWEQSLDIVSQDTQCHIHKCDVLRGRGTKPGFS